MANGIDILSDTTGQAIVESIKALGNKIGGNRHIVYGFHIDGNDSNPATRVRYLLDAVGMIPAKMNYTSGTFDYGSWADAFFMPRPCMLKFDGTVDYYLNENDLTKKLDGTDSDVANISYTGNAMMEWGDGTDIIWMKIEPDKGDPYSGSVYISNYQVDAGYHCYAFQDINGNIIPHFYTPIYQGCVDSSGRLRSISGQAVGRNRTAQQEMDAATKCGNDWYIEQYGDRLLINMLLTLISKSTDAQATFGRGYSEMGWNEADMLNTGSTNAKGLFWGENTGKLAVKVFGMENYYGNQWRRTVGLNLVNGVYKTKLTPSTADGSTVKGYNTDGTGYVSLGNTAPSGTSGGYISKSLYTEHGIVFVVVSGSSSTYEADGGWFNNAINTLTCVGGDLSNSWRCGPSSVIVRDAPSSSGWAFGAAPSCKPRAH